MIAEALSTAGMMESIAKTSRATRSFEYFENPCIFRKYFKPVIWASFRKSIIDKILQVFRLSYSVVIGIAIKRGIDLTKNVVASSIGATIKYIARPIAKNIEVSRGKTPVMMRPNKMSWIIKIRFNLLDIIAYVC